IDVLQMHFDRLSQPIRLFSSVVTEVLPLRAQWLEETIERQFDNLIASRGYKCSDIDHNLRPLRNGLGILEGIGNDAPDARGGREAVDFAGDTVPVINPLTGEIRLAHIFVAALGASNFIYAEARWSEGSPTGSACMSMRLPQSVACRRRWSATI